MNEEIAQEEEEVIVEGEIVEVEIPEEKPSGKIADLSSDVNKNTGLVDSNVKVYPCEGYGDPNILRQILISLI